MPRWDFTCEDCNVTSELVFPSVEDTQDARCPKCGGKVARQPAAGSFTIQGYSARNGYSRR